MEKYKANISVSVLLFNNDKVLLLRRYNTGYQDGKYEFPSGHIEEKETLFDSIIREVYEETGVKVKESDIQFVEVVDNNFSGKHVNFLFKCEKFEGEPQIMEKDECDDIIWANFEELDNNIYPLSIDTKRYLQLYKEKQVFNSYNSNENI